MSLRRLSVFFVNIRDASSGRTLGRVASDFGGRDVVLVCRFLPHLRLRRNCGIAVNARFVPPYVHLGCWHSFCISGVRYLGTASCTFGTFPLGLLLLETF